MWTQILPNCYMLTLGYFTYSCIFAKFVRIDVKNIENTLGNLIKCMDDLFFPTTHAEYFVPVLYYDISIIIIIIITFV